MSRAPYLRWPSVEWSDGEDHSRLGREVIGVTATAVVAFDPGVQGRRGRGSDDRGELLPGCELCGAPCALITNRSPARVDPRSRRPPDSAGATVVFSVESSHAQRDLDTSGVIPSDHVPPRLQLKPVDHPHRQAQVVEATVISSTSPDGCARRRCQRWSEPASHRPERLWPSISVIGQSLALPAPNARDPAVMW
jgi:hypothetical protein